MEVKKYRAKTMQEALSLVRRDLGPDAAVLHTRDVRKTGLLGWLPGPNWIEVTASTDVAVPSRLPARPRTAPPAAPERSTPPIDPGTFGGLAGLRALHGAGSSAADEEKKRFHDELRGQLTDLQALVEDLCRRTRTTQPELPHSLFRVYTDLIEAEVSEDLARDLIERLRGKVPAEDLNDPLLAKARLARMLEDEIRVCGPIEVSEGRRRVVALVGPTGVGKTTTIAKLAANFRLREKRRVGLITVDTYRIAAVEQLRTYADIIELPMEVVASAAEMREALARMSNLDLVLMDTAGRSPRDEIRIQELRSLLCEVRPDEVHLVLSSAGGATSLVRTAEQFAGVGLTSLLLTKLDEVSSLGNILPLLRESRLPLSYVTDGQNVPDDIRAADSRRLARTVLGMDSAEPRR